MVRMVGSGSELNLVSFPVFVGGLMG
jgi:hypothetical protein